MTDSGLWTCESCGARMGGDGDIPYPGGICAKCHANPYSDNEPFAWQCDDCRTWFGGDGEPPYYTLGDDVDASDQAAHDEVGEDHTPYLCAECCGPYMVGDEGESDPRFVRVVVNNAIDEVMSIYKENNTFDGVADVGDGLQALGTIVGRDLRAEAKKAYEEDR
jgi:ribosomal protein L37AE/L43A